MGVYGGLWLNEEVPTGDVLDRDSDSGSDLASEDEEEGLKLYP